MKTCLSRNIVVPALLALLSTLSPQLSTVHAQGTTFTYQGQLQNNGNLASGTYNLTFTLFTVNTGGTAVAGPVTNNGVAVSNGLFAVAIDFGASVWKGASNWLEIAVETNGAGSFTALTPRQQLTPTPYAIFAEGANAAGLSGTIPMSSLSGTYGGTVNFTNPASSFTGSGSGLGGVNAALLGGLASSNFWQLGGNTAAAGSQIVGTLNNQPFDLYANGVRAMRLILRTDATGVYSNAPNVVGGSPVNFVKFDVVGGTVGGGGGTDTNSVSYPNQVNADFGTISGGASNTISSFGNYSAIGGGVYNTASNYYATVAGGIANTANANDSAIAGGYGNVIPSSGDYAFIGGGTGNTASGQSATVGGGFGNTASGAFATVGGGGYFNTAAGNGSFIGGGGYDGTGTQGNVIIANAGTIGGGLGNSIPGGCRYAFIGGGTFNIASSYWTTVGGGSNNLASGGYATVAGGANNMANGNGSFVGGGGYDGSSFLGNSIKDVAAVIGGGMGNSILSGGSYSFIGGGLFNTTSGDLGVVAGGYENFATGQESAVGGGYYNSATNSFATVAGGYINAAYGNSAFVGGGSGNTASGIGSFIGGGGNDGAVNVGNYVNANAATIGGGLGNTIPSGSRYAVISGGVSNTASAYYAAVGGGYLIVASGTGAFVGGGGDDGFDYSLGNVASGAGATVGGGTGNTASGLTATVPGGVVNTASGTRSFAAGTLARATQDGSFVWSDDSGPTTTSFANNQFMARASGGVVFLSGTGATPTSYGSGTAGVALLPGATSWSTISDRNAKKNFQPVDTVAVLNKLAAIPIEQWNYKWEADTNTPNLGPMAQDFKAAFYPGRDDKSISTLEFDGVELAAIQGLNWKVEAQQSELKQKETEITELEQKNDSLEKRLETLEQIILKQKPN